MPSSPAPKPEPEQLTLFPTTGVEHSGYALRTCPRCGFSLRSMRRSLPTGTKMLRVRNWLTTRALILDNRDLLPQLDPRDYALVTDRFLLDASEDSVPSLRIPSLRALGDPLGLSAARVHQRLARALGRLDQLIEARKESPGE